MTRLRQSTRASGHRTPGRVQPAVEVIPGDERRGEALAGIAGQLTGIDPAQAAALIDRALAVAETIPGDGRRGRTVSRIHALTRSGMLDELSRWRLQSLGASVKRLDVFLGSCHDKAIAERIGLAILDW